MAIDPEFLYLQLTQLVAEMPSFDGRGVHPPETYRWLGRAATLVSATGNLADSVGIASASDALGNGLQGNEPQRITAIVFRALAYAEARAPAATRGGIVVVGEAFTALQVIGKVLAEAVTEVLIVDAYMDAKVLTDFAPLAAVGVRVRLLSDPFHTKRESLLPSVGRWAQQFGATRPLEVRLSRPRALHDRLIIVDGNLVWSVTQSLKDFAARSPALVQRIDADLSRMKVDIYADVWRVATPLEESPPP